MAQKILLNTINPDLIRNISLFSGCSEAEKDILLKNASAYSYRPKKHLFRHGEPVRNFYVLCNGALRLFHETIHGDEVTTDILMAGDTLCIADIFSPGSMHSAHAVALSEVVVMEFPVTWLRENIQRYHQISVNLLSALSEQAQELQTEAKNQAMMSAAQLAACFLQKACVFHDFNTAGFDLPYRKSLMASRLGMKVETLSRVFPKLKELGITVEGKHVIFDSLPDIKRNVCDHCPGMEHCPVHKALH